MTTLDDLARELYAADDAYNAAWSTRMAAGISSDHLCRGDVPPSCEDCGLLHAESLASDRVLYAELAILAYLRAQRPKS